MVAGLKELTSNTFLGVDETTQAYSRDERCVVLSERSCTKTMDLIRGKIFPEADLRNALSYQIYPAKFNFDPFSQKIVEEISFSRRSRWSWLRVAVRGTHSDPLLLLRLHNPTFEMRSGKKNYQTNMIDKK